MFMCECIKIRKRKHEMLKFFGCCLLYMNHILHKRKDILCQKVTKYIKGWAEQSLGFKIADALVNIIHLWSLLIKWWHPMAGSLIRSIPLWILPLEIPEVIKYWPRTTDELKDFICHEITAILEAMNRWALQKFKVNL